MNELDYLKDLAGIEKPQEMILVESTDEILEEGVARSIDFNKVTELFNATYSSSWYNKHYRGLRFDKGYVEVMSQAKYRRINLSKLSKETFDYFKKLVKTNAASGAPDILSKFENKSSVDIAFYAREGRGVWLSFFNAQSDRDKQEDISVFNVSTENFKKLANKNGYKIIPSDAIRYKLKNMSFSEERNQIEITVDTDIMITHSNYVKTKEGTPNNTLVIKQANNAEGLFSNFETTYQSSSPTKDTEDLGKWLKTHISGFKITEFRKLVKQHFGEIFNNYEASNAVQATFDILKAEIGEDVYGEVEKGIGTLSIKRWSKVNFIFKEDDIVDSTNWTISRTLDDKSVEYINSLVKKVTKRMKGLVNITWTEEEKWHVYFKITKA